MRVTYFMFRDVITLNNIRWIALRSKLERLTTVVGYTTSMAYCLTLIRIYSSILYKMIRGYSEEMETQICE